MGVAAAFLFRGLTETGARLAALNGLEDTRMPPEIAEELEKLTEEAETTNAEETTETEESEGTEETEATEEQTIPRARLDKEVAKRKTAEERLAAQETELATTKAKLTDAEARADEQALKAAATLRLDPAYLSQEELALVTEANELQAKESALSEELDDLYPDAPEVKTKRRELRETQQRLRAIEAPANEAYARAKKVQGQDLIEGRKARLAREAAARKAKETGGGKETPTGGAAGGGGSTERRGSPPSKQKFSLESFKADAKKDPRSAASKALSMLVPE